MTVLHSLEHALACPYCEAAIDAGSRSVVDYALAGSATLVVALTIGYALKCLLRPGEHGPDHIKVKVLNDALVDESEGSK